MAKKLSIISRYDTLERHYDKCLEDDCPVCYKFLTAALGKLGGHIEELQYAVNKRDSATRNEGSANKPAA